MSSPSRLWPLQGLGLPPLISPGPSVSGGVSSGPCPAIILRADQGECGSCHSPAQHGTKAAQHSGCRTAGTAQAAHQCPPRDREPRAQRHGTAGSTEGVFITFITSQLKVLLKTGSASSTPSLALRQWSDRLWIGYTTAQRELQSLYLTKLSTSFQRVWGESLQCLHRRRGGGITQAWDKQRGKGHPGVSPQPPAARRPGAAGTSARGRVSCQHSPWPKYCWWRK